MARRARRSLNFADLFCGAGGTTVGAESTGEANACFALNHWDVAIKTHSANHPHCHHVQSKLADTKPSECRDKLDLLFASPECTHHSRARGGRPTSDQQRSGAWEIMPWIDYHRPNWLVVENVPEFQEWGPVGYDGKPLKTKKGQIFQSWLKAIEAHGYKLEFGILNAADFGAGTSRKRLFVIGRRGRRAVPWPEPTHTKLWTPESSLQPWKPAHQSIDWTIPCPSIFNRVRPLADKTLLRIEAGLRKFVEPFVVQFRNNMDGGSLRDPLTTITCGGGHHGLAVPFQYQLIGNGAGRSRAIDDTIPTIIAARENHGVATPMLNSTCGGGVAREAGQPLPTITTKGGAWAAVPFIAQVNHGDDRHTGSRVYSVENPMGTVTSSNGRALAVPYMLPFFGERPGQTPRTNDVQEALPTVTSHGAGGVAMPFLAQWDNTGWGGNAAKSAQDPVPTLVTKANTGLALPFLMQYYSSGGQWSGVDGPVPTIVAKTRHGVVAPIVQALCTDWPEPTTDAQRKLQATMRELGVADIGFRMLSNPELADAQGFPIDYLFYGSKADVTRQIGNSVSPSAARAITKTLLGV